MHKSKNTGSRVLSGRHRGAKGTPLIATFSGTLDNRLTRYNILTIFPQASEPIAPHQVLYGPEMDFQKTVATVTMSLTVEKVPVTEAIPLPSVFNLQ